MMLTLGKEKIVTSNSTLKHDRFPGNDSSPLLLASKGSVSTRMTISLCSPLSSFCKTTHTVLFILLSMPVNDKFPSTTVNRVWFRDRVATARQREKKGKTCFLKIFIFLVTMALYQPEVVNSFMFFSNRIPRNFQK